MKVMTSRERVLAALNRREPDRVPVDIGGGSSTSISFEGYERLKAHLGVSAAPRAMSKLFRVALLDESVLQRLGSDCRPLRGKGPAHWTPRAAEPGTTTDIWGVTWRQVSYPAGGVYWEIVRNPLAGATTADLDCYPWPDPTDPGYTAGLAGEARDLFEGTGYAIEASSGFYSLWELAVNLRGYEQMLSDLTLNPEFVTALMEKLLTFNLAGTARFLDAVGPYIQIYRAADDLATQASCLMSPAMYRRLLKPYYRRYFDFVKAHTDAKIVYHSCGNVTKLIDDLIEIGVDALNPVQVSALGDSAALKAHFGDRITFWGGIDTQHVLPHGTPADVAAEVHRRIRDFAPGGGFVLAAVHSIQPDVPPENILAMADAARTYGRYPLE
jgi:uroporphyrinogen decarboxylase